MINAALAGDGQARNLVKLLSDDGIAGGIWEPNETTYGSGLKDQIVAELFTRLQVTENLQITPDIQYIKNPALNPDEDHSVVLGLRMRVVF